MKTTNVLLRYLILFVATFGFITSVAVVSLAQEISGSGPVMFFRDQPSVEPSGVAPIGDGTYLLVADDNTRDLLIVEKQTGKILRTNVVIPGLNRYPDWEAMAKDGEDFYLIGSKGLLFRFRLNEQEKDWSKIQVTAAKELVISNFGLVKTELKGRRPEIEGLAIYSNDQKKELVVGIRERQSVGPRTAAIHFFGAEIVEAALTLKPFFKFDATEPAVPGAAEVAWHLSSIEHVPDWNGFLVMTTTENADRYYGSILWFVPEAQLKQPPNAQGPFRLVVPTRSKVFQESIPGGRPGIKAEGLAVLSNMDSKLAKQTVSAVIVFDNDSRAPSALLLVELAKPTNADPSGF
ncbi:MAG TPA: hypothetical protein VJU84_06360 [Pyrinomonadaceae bacterium]|nr:hypothetical protein [Pyrinomonadaceae bacterium]